ncbi:hypothetical protein IOZ78_000817 [Salmonella enterica]|nr:hypothetical protein [Salmonella enterica]EDU6026665.1 hypothetical protein [Salmonella enterica subsp. enterica serovar Brazil]EAY2233674.1 hypothetical protein [Salmonella enterica]EBH5054942.1 hypothetical protein [Salmonella enterica]EBN7764485.1 hypothetical protein [Salmonella enterica]
MLTNFLSNDAWQGKQCGCKKRHKTADGAQIELWIIRKRYGHQGQMGVYRCPFCNNYHVGHTPGRNGIGSGYGRWR